MQYVQQVLPSSTCSSQHTLHHFSERSICLSVERDIVM